jgi:putative ABC transport system permease protein
VDKEFENSDAETKTEPEGAFVQAWASQIGNIALMVVAILGAVFFTILLVAGNTMSQAVRERTGELGVLKAIGFTNAQVVALCPRRIVPAFGARRRSRPWAGVAAHFARRSHRRLLPLFFFPGRDLLIGAGLSLALGIGHRNFPRAATLRLRVADALRRM